MIFLIREQSKECNTHEDFLVKILIGIEQGQISDKNLTVNFFREEMSLSWMDMRHMIENVNVLRKRKYIQKESKCLILPLKFSFSL